MTMHTLNPPLVSSALTGWLLGTAQFGLEYGITNETGKTPQDEAWSMIYQALANGAIGIDTAAGYGAAEEVLSQNPLSTKITTKIVCLSDLSIRQQIENSLSRINCRCLDTVLIHDIQNLRTKGVLESACREFEELKTEGFITSAGVSVYEVADTHELLKVWTPDVIQLPLNPLNQAFTQSGELARLRDSGIQLQARSLFLQGVLLAEKLPHRLQHMSGIFAQWQEFLRINKLSSLSACKSFAAAQALIDHWVLGFENLAQLNQFIEAPIIECSMADCAVSEVDLVNPSKW